MAKKRIKLTREDYPRLREHFLNVFMKKTYKRKSDNEERWLRIFASEPRQPRIRKRYLAEKTYNGKYQPGSYHKPNPNYNNHEYPFIVLGRYFTVNLGYENYRIRVINLRDGKLGFISVG